jgi:hypothetical protein
MQFAFMIADEFWYAQYLIIYLCVACGFNANICF